MTIRGLRAIPLLALATTLVGCAQPTVSPFIQAAPLRGEARDPEYTLVITSPQSSWKAGEAIEVSAELTYDGPPASATIWSSGGGVIGFSVFEMGGDRRMEAVRTSDCKEYTIGPDQPITTPYRKSGAIDPGEPNEAFYTEFFADPLLRLPSGLWHVTAWASLVIGPEPCGGRKVDLQASLMFRVE